MPVDWLATGAALLAGLLGGVHCAAMCGGIAAGFSAMAPAGGWRAALEPNLGRVLGYAAAGAIAGGIGHGIVGIARIDALATSMRAAAGLVLVAVALRLFTGARGLAVLDRGNRALWRWLQPLQRALLPADTPARRIALGALWGWLPCGLSASVLVAAWLQADALRGAVVMAAFGLGTLPLMVPLTFSGARLVGWLRRGGARHAVAGLVMAAGVLTLAAPWLVQVPALHGVLSALGCLPPSA